MKAWFIRKYGGPNVLEFGDVSEPSIGSHDLLVEIRAASINPIDSKVRNGALKLLVKYNFPLVMGTDLSGVVIKIGANVTRFSVGDEIYARPHRLRIGAFAERIAIHQDEAALKPKSLNFEEAASIPLVGLTTLQAMQEIAKVKPGHKVFIQAGAGGIGTFAIQLAKHLGAYVAVTASKGKHDLVRSLGADEVIDYRNQDFSVVLKDYDMVFDTLGGEALIRSFKVLHQGGIVVSIVWPPDIELTQNWPMPFYLKLAIRMMSWKVRRTANRHNCHYRFMLMRPDGKQLDEIAALIDDGVIRPVIDRIYPFEKVGEAMHYGEAGHATGKIIISREMKNGSI